MITGFVIFLIDFVIRDVLISPPADEMQFQAYLASIWILVLVFNIIIISFDFSLGKTFTIFITLSFLAMIVFVALPAFDIQLPIINFSLADSLSSLNISATPAFYLVISIIILIIFIFIFIGSRFNYWEFDSNRIVHHRGVFEREENFNAQNSRVITATEDIFERLLFRAGTITIIDPRQGVHILQNVYNAVNKDKKIQELLSVVRVRSADQ